MPTGYALVFITTRITHSLYQHERYKYRQYLKAWLCAAPSISHEAVSIQQSPCSPVRPPRLLISKAAFA